MSTVSTGHHAENAAIEHLKSDKYRLIDQNWKTRWCEIDAIMQRGSCIYFVEVKYRAQPMQGSGLEYITKTKQRQMLFAAEMWIHQYGWEGDWSLLGVAVEGPDFKVTEVVEI